MCEQTRTSPTHAALQLTQGVASIVKPLAHSTFAWAQEFTLLHVTLTVKSVYAYFQINSYRAPSLHCSLPRHPKLPACGELQKKGHKKPPAKLAVVTTMQLHKRRYVAQQLHQSVTGLPSRVVNRRAMHQKTTAQ
jgi:hypothetical protein